MFRSILSSSLRNRNQLNLSKLLFHRACSSNYVKISPEVKEAVDNGRPVIAMESTILTHGLPKGVNLDPASRLESLCKKEGVLGATIGVVDGILTVGMTPYEL